jgi:CIC family chloride channel protein
MEDLFPSLPGNAYTQNILGMLMIGVLSYGFVLATGQPHTSGVGYATIQSIVSNGHFTLLLFVALLLGKLLATAISLGCGASGGVFSPSLFIGAALGGLVGTLSGYLDPAGNFSVPEFAVVGMGAIVGGATGASMTAIVMIFEMTRDYNVIVPLVLAVALAVGVRRWLVAENIYTIKLRNRGRPIPTIRHTNMYLVQQARDLMSACFVVLPAETRIETALEAVAGKPGAHIIVTEEGRILGFVRFGSVPYKPSDTGDQTLRGIVSTEFVIAPETSILNTIVTRMNRRNRSFAIVVKPGGAVPRPDDVVGVIDSPEIAGSVIRNHYA